MNSANVPANSDRPAASLEADAEARSSVECLLDLSPPSIIFLFLFSPSLRTTSNTQNHQTSTRPFTMKRKQLPSPSPLSSAATESEEAYSAEKAPSPVEEPTHANKKKQTKGKHAGPAAKNGNGKKPTKASPPAEGKSKKMRAWTPEEEAVFRADQLR